MPSGISAGMWIGALALRLPLAELVHLRLRHRPNPGAAGTHASDAGFQAEVGEGQISSQKRQSTSRATRKEPSQAGMTALGCRYASKTQGFFRKSAAPRAASSLRQSPPPRPAGIVIVRNPKWRKANGPSRFQSTGVGVFGADDGSSLQVPRAKGSSFQSRASRPPAPWPRGEPRDRDAHP